MTVHLLGDNGRAIGGWENGEPPRTGEYISLRVKERAVRYKVLWVEHCIVERPLGLQHQMVTVRITPSAHPE